MGVSKNSWVIEVRSFLEEATEEDETTPVSIFTVPKSLSIYNPEAYTPQLISFGPYHHQRNDILEMDRYKLIVAKRVVKSKYNSMTYEQLATRVSKHELRIRACYYKHFNEIDSETLSWLMAIDALFIIEFLQAYRDHIDRSFCTSYKGKLLFNGATPGRTMSSYLVHASGRKIGYDAVLRDVFMVENQIPLFVLKKVFNLRCVTALEVEASLYSEEVLVTMIVGVCRELSPLKIVEFEDDDEKGNVFQYFHLLDLLYHLIVPKPCKQQEDYYQKTGKGNINTSSKDRESGEKEEGDHDHEVKSKICSCNVSGKEVFTSLWGIISKCNGVLIRGIKAIIFSKPLKMLVKLPWKLFSKLPFVSLIGPALESFFSNNNNNNNETSTTENIGSNNDLPTVEETNVPSVTSLHKAGIQFQPTNGSINTIKFDRKTRKLQLPVVTLDVNSEVILRNLVAYEALSVSGPLVMARYTEFMNGIIDTAEDAKLLREKKIIVNRLKNDQEVADMWNGMSRSVSLTKVKVLDEAIDGVNKFYEGTWRVKGYKFMKRAVFGSWEVLLVLATILLLSLMAVQAFCSVYSCPRLFDLPTGTDSR